MKNDAYLGEPEALKAPSEPQAMKALVERSRQAKKRSRIRKQAAIALVKEGVSFAGVALELDCSKSTVHRWWKTYQKKGSLGLYPKSSPGRPSILDPKQMKILKVLLQHQKSWKLKNVSVIIADRFQQTFNPHHLPRILKKLDWIAKGSVWTQRPKV